MSRSSAPNIEHKYYSIGEVAGLTGLSADTLRYYEKIKLLPSIGRTASGIRCYGERDLSRLRFIQRAKGMNFSLEEISRLLEMREDPQNARDEVRELTHQKLEAVEYQMAELDTLRKELTLLINLCRGAEGGCPIIDDMDK
ncbi:hypothetical protein MNBD_GAMMA13-500 [hydrothermal vent metagenome]|uniref:HTH merR-type domain-containing protein n=1 Tax=hydrothermal vent metagenome TaxID=652676 RepID=A0A3B0YQ78_9ZZZZ